MFCFVYNKYYIMYSWVNWRLADFLSPSEVFLQRKAGLLASQVIAEMGMNQGEERGGEVGRGRKWGALREKRKS